MYENKDFNKALKTDPILTTQLCKQSPENKAICTKRRKQHFEHQYETKLTKQRSANAWENAAPETKLLKQRSQHGFLTKLIQNAK